MINHILKYNNDLLKGKKVLLSLTGSIAVYKSVELIRLLTKSGADVRVMMSDGAKRFVTPLLIEALTHNKVLDYASESWTNEYNHISIGKWADVMVIAPATANTINKLSNGIADNLLTQSALAYNGTKLIAPAMNTNMLTNPITQASLKMLNLSGYEIISPIQKSLACGDSGDGALANVEDIYYKIAQKLLLQEYWHYRKVIITSGGTVEKIDDVRYISNYSSGKMGSALALALYLRGANVCHITTKNISMPSDLHTISVSSSAEMYTYLSDAIDVAKKPSVIKPTLTNNLDSPKLVQKEPYLFMASAVSDYVPRYPQSGKLKKEMLGEYFALELIKNIDILSSIKKDGIKVVGFKAEMDKANAKINAQNALISKGLDAICLNVLDESNTFGSDTNILEIITRDDSTQISQCDKLSIAFEMLKSLE